MFKRAKAAKAKQLKAALAQSKRNNPSNRQGSKQRISSRNDLRNHVQRENEPYG